MKLSDFIGNVESTHIVGNSHLVTQNEQRRSEDFVRKYLGLAIARSSFYGMIAEDDSIIPLRSNELSFDIPTPIKIVLEGYVVLDKEPTNTGGLSYVGTGLLEVDKVVVYDTRWKDGGTSSTIYTGDSPTTVTVGGLPAGSDILGLEVNEILEDILVPYLSPAFSSFSISGQTNPIEVGVDLSGNKTFSWSTTNSSNVKANSISIIDVTGSSTLATGLANDGSESVNIGTVTNTSPISQVYRIEGENNKDVAITPETYTINSIYPYFYGKVSSGGAVAGANRPVANQALIDSGTKVVQNSNGSFSVNFNSGTDDYIWFAIPLTSGAKNNWYVTALNNGDIGGSVDVSGNLFPDSDGLTVTTVNWSGISYLVYISNYQTASTVPMTIS